MERKSRKQPERKNLSLNGKSQLTLQQTVEAKDGRIRYLKGSKETKISRHPQVLYPMKLRPKNAGKTKAFIDEQCLRYLLLSDFSHTVKKQGATRKGNHVSIKYCVNTWFASFIFLAFFFKVVVKR